MGVYMEKMLSSSSPVAAAVRIVGILSEAEETLQSDVALQTLMCRPPRARLILVRGSSVQGNAGLRMTFGTEKGTASWQCWRLSRGYTVQKVEGMRKSHRGQPETWVS